MNFAPAYRQAGFQTLIQDEFTVAILTKNIEAPFILNL